MDKPAFYCQRVGEAYRCSSEIPIYGAAWPTSGDSANDTNFAVRRHLPASRRLPGTRSSVILERARRQWLHRGTAQHLLTEVIRRAGLKPAAGRVGPRVHDLRHAFVVGRMLSWYREGVDAQSRLPYLATYLGHKDIYSTLVYLTITQELLQQASEPYRVVGARVLKATKGGVSCA
jgi:integrase